MDLQIDDFQGRRRWRPSCFYQAFPRKTALYVEDLIGREAPDEFGLPSKTSPKLSGALLWLAEEGYLRFANTIHYEASTRRCSAKRPSQDLPVSSPAAAALAEAPASVRREQASLANQLRQALAQGDGERLAGLTRLLFEGNLGAQGDTVGNSPSIESPWTAPYITPHDYQEPVRPPRRPANRAPCLQP